MTLQQRINELFADQPDKSVQGLADHTGIRRQTVYSWLNGKVKTIYNGKHYLVADYFQCNVDWLTQGIGGKYASNDNGLLDNVDESCHEISTKIDKTALEKQQSASMLGSVNNKLTSEETMDFELLSKINQADGNIMHAIFLLTEMKGAKDPDSFLVRALKLASLSATPNMDIKVECKPVASGNPKTTKAN